MVHPENNLSKANYYYRLQRVREVCLDQMQATSPTFFELPTSSDTEASPTVNRLPMENSMDPVPVIRIKNKNGVSAEVFSDTSLKFLVIS